MDTPPSDTPERDTTADGPDTDPGGVTDPGDAPSEDGAQDGTEQASFMGVWREGASGWEQVGGGVAEPIGTDEPAPKWWQLHKREVHVSPMAKVRLTSVTTSVIVTVLVALLALPLVAGVAGTVSDLLRRAPQPLLSGPVTQDDTGAEELYKSVSRSVVTLATADGSSGSGFVYRPGLVLTNWHVVAASPERAAALSMGEELGVTVIDATGRVRNATVVAGDARLDLALVAVDDLDDLPALPLGDPDVLEVGQPIYLVGSPFGIPGTMTSGQLTGVSVNTAFAQSTVQTGLLMTDAAANPGNSGGPMLSADGTVVGVVTLRPDESGGRTVQGLTFALPADAVAWAAGYLERGETPPYSIIGISGGTASPDLGTTGVFVQAVSEDLPAAAAGVRAGDVVVRAGGEPIEDFDDLVDVLREFEVGEAVELVLLRPVDPDAVAPDAIGPDGLPEQMEAVEREQVVVSVELAERPQDV